MVRKTALYARGINDLGAALNIKKSSTYQQATGLEAQSRALTDCCRLNRIENYELFADEGISGTKSSRPALDRMMATIKTGEAECVVVYSFSRFARSTTHMLNGLETMKAHGCNFVSLTEKIDTNSPIGKAVFVIISAIAALERDLIAERVKNGLANARAKGKLIGRKKLRDSDLIRKLLAAGMSYRKISLVARCSHGSVSAERAAMKKEELARLAKLEADRKAQEQFMAEQTEAATTVVFPEAA